MERLIDAGKLKAVLQNIKEHLEESGEPQSAGMAAVFAHVMEIVDIQLAVEAANNQLTLDQLREMDGEPVYMLDLTGGELWSQWIIFQKHSDDGFIPKGGGWFSAENYGKTWLAFCRRPEGV